MERRKLLTIVTESIIEDLVVEDLRKLGARGYTAVEARGEGAFGARQGEWDQNTNIRIEVVCEETTARTIAERLVESFGQNYALIVYISDVEVIRTERF